MIENSQVKKIHALVKSLKWDKDFYKEVLFAGYGVDSSKNLNFNQAEDFILRLEDLAIELGVWKKPEKKYVNLSDRENMATPAQLRMIEGIWMEVSYVKDRKQAKKALRKFLTRQFSISDIRFLDKKTASKVINAIKNIKKEKEKNYAN